MVSMRIDLKIRPYPLISLFIVLIDQWIKQCVRRLPLQETFFIIPGFFELTHTINTGAAFSLFSGQPGIIAFFSIVLLTVLFFLLNQTTRLTKNSRFLLSVLIGAGAGNLVDRVIFGGVTDYIRLLFLRFPVFNFADICITCSVIALSIFIITGRLDRQPEGLSHGSDD